MAMGDRDVRWLTVLAVALVTVAVVLNVLWVEWLRA